MLSEDFPSKMAKKNQNDVHQGIPWSILRSFDNLKKSRCVPVVFFEEIHAIGYFSTIDHYSTTT